MHIENKNSTYSLSSMSCGATKGRLVDVMFVMFITAQSAKDDLLLQSWVTSVTTTKHPNHGVRFGIRLL